MNGKLRKIALGISVLMCAGMLFTSALTAKATIVCKHPTLLYLVDHEDIIDMDNYNDYGHWVNRETRAYCTTCGEMLVMEKESVGYVPHDIVTTIRWNEQTGTHSCTQCNYKVDFILKPAN